MRRSPMLLVALLAAVGSAAIYLSPLPALWRMARPYGLLFGALGVAQITTAVAVLVRPTRRRVLLAAAPALAVFVLWALERFAGALPAPNPWVPADSVLGFTDALCAGSESIAVVGLAAATALPVRAFPLEPCHRTPCLPGS